MATGTHYYTTGSNCDGFAGATNEGSMGFIATNATCGAIPLYRLFLPSLGVFLYTTSSSEMVSTQADGFVYQAIAGYVWTPPLP